MREILFRGKVLRRSEWCQGFPILTDKCNVLIANTAEENGCGICIQESNSMRNYEVDPATVGQCSTVPDKTGKLMYEGDIVKGLFLFGMEILAVVVFQNGAFGLEWNRGSVKEFSAFTSFCNVQFEIVGNIHDNPELLEVSE